MATLTRAQIRQYAQGAGFAGNDLDIAVAVAFAESGGDPNAYNPVGKDRSYGLMQINMIGSLGPDRRSKFKLSKNEDLFDPATNMRVAYGIKQGSGWAAWTTYTRGTYKKFMNDDSAAVTASESQENVSTPASDGGIVTGGLNALGQSIFRSAANMGGVAVALVMIVAAVAILAFQSQTGKKLVKAGVKKVV